MNQTVSLRRRPDPRLVLERNRALLPRATCYAYQTINGQDLEAYVFPASGEAPEDGRPVVLFFYSSGWDSGQVSQFAPHCLYLAGRGMTSILIDYRVHSRFPGSGPEEAMADARAAIRWARANAPELGINPDRLVASGGSAGAHAALAAALPLEEPGAVGEDAAISCRPDALVLFDPVFRIPSGSPARGLFPDKRALRRMDLLRAVRRDMPPVLLFHGTADRVTPFSDSKKFRRKMWWRRNFCRLSRYEGAVHGFFNFNVNPRLYELTLSEMDAFLVEREFLPPPAGEEVEDLLRLASDGLRVQYV